MPDAKTITEHKAAFIRAQVRYLSAPLKPSPEWRTTNTTDQSDSSISEKTVDDIVGKLDGKVKQHNRKVFALQSQRHVAEQIDTLYWNEVSSDNVKANADTTWVKKNVDLCETDTIQELPQRYSDLHFHPEHEASEDDVRRYGEMRARLNDLVVERDEKRQRVEAYRQLKELLRPLENAKETVQPNLVTKDGELSSELEKMKMLITRVTARLGQASNDTANGAGNDLGQITQTNEEKLSHVLDLR